MSSTKAAKSTVTLHDVAKLAGVSHTTVARVVKQNPNISEKTKTAVQKAIQELGYIPPRRPSVQGKATKRIEVIFFQQQANAQGAPSSGFYLNVFWGIQSASKQYSDIDVHIGFSDLIGSDKPDFMDLANCDGIILVGNSDRQWAEAAAATGVPVVLADCEHDGLNLDCILSDNYLGGRLAVSHILSQGLTKIGWVGEIFHKHAWKQRYQGLCLALGEAGMELDKNFICLNYEEDRNLTSERITAWLKHPSRPEVIVMPNSHYAIMIERIMLVMGLKCPDDIQLITFAHDNDNFEEIPEFEPNILLTNPKRIGEKALERIVELIGQPVSGRNPEKVLIPVTFH